MSHADVLLFHVFVTAFFESGDKCKHAVWARQYAYVGYLDSLNFFSAFDFSKVEIRVRNVYSCVRVNLFLGLLEY